MAPIVLPTYTFRNLVRGGLIVCGLLLLTLYIVWQARFLIEGPMVTLTTEPARIQNDRVVWLEGSVRNITNLTLNGRQIFTDPNGHFKEALVLENGYTIATIAATDRYGRVTTLERPFMYTPASLVSR